MRKHHWRQQIKSLFEKHADPEKHEQMKETRNDMEEKKEKIIKLIKGREPDGSNGKPESLEELVKDYHKQYESLYELYHNLTGELKKKVHDKYEEGKEKFSTSSSDSDSEGDHSSKGKGSKNGELQNNFQRVTGELREELEAANHEIDNLRMKLAASNEEKEVLSSECATALSKLQDTEKAIDDLKIKSERWGDERLQLMSENNRKKESEEELEIKAKEVEVLSDETSRLKAQISQLEATLKERQDQYSDMLKKLEDIERESESKMEALTAQLKKMEKEAETIRAQKSELEEQLINKNGEASAQMKELFDHLNSFQKELSTLATLKAEMESELERKSREVSENLTQIETLTEKLVSSEADQKRILEEKNSIAEKVQGFESEVESLNNQKSELEDEIRSITNEATDLRVEIVGLKQRIIELEGSVLEKENVCATLESKIQDGEYEASSKITALTDEIDRLKKELEGMQAGKTDFESKKEIMSQLENENAELRSKVVDLELNLRAAERKTEELSRGNESNDQLVIELQTTIEDLKRDIEMDKDELLTIEEKNRNLEVMLRLSNQKLRVTEQLLSEKEAIHQQLEEKHATLSQTLESYSDMIKDISEQVNASLAALECAVTKKFDEDYGGLAKKVFSLSEEVRSVKSWVTAKRSEKEAMAAELEKVKGEEAAMRTRIENLELEAEKEKAEKEEAARALSQLDKAVREKDERLLGLGEEKREAIRQLCVWIEYHRSHCVELRGILLKMAPKAPRTTTTTTP